MQEGTELTKFEWRGRTGPFTLTLAPGVFTPTHTSLALAEVIEIRPGEVVADIGCGCGVLAFVAARLGAARVYGTDVSEEAIRAGELNARALGLGGVVDLRTGHLSEPLAGITVDVVIGDVSGVPDSLAEAAGWLPGGGPTGAETPLAMLEKLDPMLAPGGRLYLPTGSLQDDETILAAARDIFGPGNVDLLATRRFPLPSSAAREDILDDLVARGVARFERHGSRWLWTLRLWCCRRPA
jgi:precorrin-6B methylase 2